MKEFKPESILVSLSVERSAARLAEQDLKRYQLEKIRNAERLIEGQVNGLHRKGMLCPDDNED